MQRWAQVERAQQQQTVHAAGQVFTLPCRAQGAQARRAGTLVLVRDALNSCTLVEEFSWLP